MHITYPHTCTHLHIHLHIHIDQIGKAECARAEGTAWCRHGDQKKGLQKIRWALEVARGLGNKPLMCECLMNMGQACAQVCVFLCCVSLCAVSVWCLCSCGVFVQCWGVSLCVVASVSLWYLPVVSLCGISLWCLSVGCLCVVSVWCLCAMSMSVSVCLCVCVSVCLCGCGCGCGCGCVCGDGEWRAGRVYEVGVG